MFGSGMFPMSTLPDRRPSSKLTTSLTTTAGSSSCANGQGQAAVVGHVPMPSIDFDLISLHDAIAFATAAAAATQVQTIPSLAVGMPPQHSQASLLSTMYRHPAIVISSPPGEQVTSVNDNPYLTASSSAEQCSGFQQVFGGGSVSADGFRRYSRFQPPPLDGDLALAALMAPISAAAAAAAAASATAFSSGLMTSQAQSSSIVTPSGGYRTMTSFSKERGKGMSFGQMASCKKCCDKHGKAILYY